MKNFTSAVWDMTYLILIGMLVLVAPAYAETLQLSPEECESFAGSGGTIAKWRLDGITLEEAYKNYDEQVGEPKSVLTEKNKLIYLAVKKQIKFIYDMSKEDFAAITPQDIAIGFYKSCMAAKGVIHGGDTI